MLKLFKTRGVGIGRQGVLKIRWPKSREGSSPFLEILTLKASSLIIIIYSGSQNEGLFSFLKIKIYLFFVTEYLLYIANLSTYSI